MSVIASVATLLVASLALAGGDGGADKERLFFRGPASVDDLGKVVVGRGIVGTDPAEVTVDKGGKVEWRQVRDETDELGMRHVHYLQVWVPQGPLASRLDKSYHKDGVPLEGALIAVHTYSDGKPRAVIGRQRLGVVLLNEPTIALASEAHDVAEQAARSYPGFEAPDPSQWLAQRSALTTETALFLQAESDGVGYRFAWRVALLDRRGARHIAILDAGTGGVLSLSPAVVGVESCAPLNFATTTVTANRERDIWVTRSVWTTPGSQKSGYDREAHRGFSDAQSPQIEAYLTTNDAAYNCTVDIRDEKWGMLPLTAANFENSTWPCSSCAGGYQQVPGRAAADALFFTYETMRTFQELGRNSWDGSGDAARVVVGGESNGLAPYFGHADSDPWTPVNGVWLGKVGSPTTLQLHWGSSVDMVAHEWGHAAQKASGINFDTCKDGNECNQLSEGFADAVAYSVEQSRQPQPPCWQAIECADWKIGEDAGPLDGLFFWRRVDAEGKDLPYLGYHKDDGRVGTPANPLQYVRGNVVGVAFRLLALGGQNPWCATHPGATGCSTVVSAQGLDRARRIFFRMMTAYYSQATPWVSLPDIAKLAAFDVYSRCASGYAATTIQQQAENAFAAVGYLGDGIYETCYP